MTTLTREATDSLLVRTVRAGPQGPRALDRQVVDGLSAQLVATLGFATFRTATDSLTSDAAPTRAAVLARATAEARATADGFVIGLVSKVRTATDSITRSDAAVRSNAMLRTAADARAQADVATRPTTIGTPSVTSITENGVTLNWPVSPNAGGFVQYGDAGGAPGVYTHETVHETNLLPSHTQAIAGLAASSTYRYRLAAVDAQGGVTYSIERTFTTATAAAVVSGITVSNVTASGFTVGWHVVPASYGRLQWDTAALANPSTNGTLTAEQVAPLSDHSQVISGAPADSDIHFRIWTTAAGIGSGDQVQHTAAASSGTFPPLTAPAVISVPTPSVPAYLTPTVVPPSSGTITRITNTAGRRHLYSKIAAANRDGSLVYCGYGNVMLDGSTYAVLGSWSPLSEPVWSNVLATKNRMWGVNGNSTLAYQTYPSTSVTNVHDFAADGYSHIRLGMNEGSLSYNDRYIAFQARRASDGAAVLISYDIVAATIRGSRVVPGVSPDAGSGSWDASLETNSQISPDGGSLIVNFEGSNGTGFPQGVWDLNAASPTLAAFRQLNDNGDHGDSMKNAAGQDVWVQCYGTNVWCWRLGQSSSALDVGVLLPAGAGATYRQGHVSGRAIDRWGYAYLSTDLRTTAQCADQIISVKLDGSAVSGAGIEVWCFAGAQMDNPNGASQYTRQPHACPSADGQRVFFASDRDNATDTGTVYMYVAEAA